MYWSKPQIEARSNKSLLNTSKAFLQLFHAPHQAQVSVVADTSRAISLSTLLTYADRMRVRPPGDSKFSLGPHVSSLYARAELLR